MLGKYNPLKEGSLPTKVKQVKKIKGVKPPKDSKKAKEFFKHHVVHNGPHIKGQGAEHATYDFDDDDYEVDGGLQKRKDKQKRGYEPVESVKEINLKDPKQFDNYMQHVLNQFKTPAEKKMKKDIIRKLNVVQKKRGRKIFKEEFVNERKNPKREKLKKDFKTSLKFVKGVIRKIDTFMKSNDWGVVDGFVTNKRTGLASLVKDMEKSMNQIIKMPVDESVNEAFVNNLKQAMSYINTDTKDGKEFMKLMKQKSYTKQQGIRAMTLAMRGSAIHCAGPGGVSQFTMHIAKNVKGLK